MDISGDPYLASHNSIIMSIHSQTTNIVQITNMTRQPQVVPVTATFFPIIAFASHLPSLFCVRFIELPNHNHRITPTS